LSYAGFDDVSEIAPLLRPGSATQFPVIVVGRQTVISSTLNVQCNQIHAEPAFVLEQPVLDLLPANFQNCQRNKETKKIKMDKSNSNRRFDGIHLSLSIADAGID